MKKEQHFITVIVIADGEQTMKEEIELITDGEETFNSTLSSICYDIVGVIADNAPSE